MGNSDRGNRALDVGERPGIKVAGDRLLKQAILRRVVLAVRVPVSELSASVPRRWAIRRFAGVQIGEGAGRAAREQTGVESIGDDADPTRVSWGPRVCWLASWIFSSSKGQDLTRHLWRSKRWSLLILWDLNHVADIFTEPTPFSCTIDFEGCSRLKVHIAQKTFTLRKVKGRLHRLTEFDRRVIVLVIISASFDRNSLWCSPCLTKRWWCFEPSFSHSPSSTSLLWPSTLSHAIERPSLLTILSWNPLPRALTWDIKDIKGASGLIGKGEWDSNHRNCSFLDCMWCYAPSAVYPAFYWPNDPLVLFLDFLVFSLAVVVDW